MNDEVLCSSKESIPIDIDKVVFDISEFDFEEDALSLEVL